MSEGEQSESNEDAPSERAPQLRIKARAPKSYEESDDISSDESSEEGKEII